MSAYTIPKTIVPPALRAGTITAFVTAALLAGQPLAAHAETTANAPMLLAQAAAPQSPAAADATETKAETLEQRITNLHASLKITADEEANWNGVAQAMRENAAAMEKLAAEKAAKDPASLTAVDDLKNYEAFAQAHVAGLKNLITAFETLYKVMPAAQKKNADEVFQSFGHQDAASHS
jgi:protein CpxP